MAQLAFQSGNKKVLSFFSPERLFNICSFPDKMNQQDIDTLQIAIGSSERFNEDASTPANPDPFRNRDLLESLLDDSNDDPSPNTTNWQSPPDRAVVEFYICRPGCNGRSLPQHNQLAIFP